MEGSVYPLQSRGRLRSQDKRPRQSKRDRDVVRGSVDELDIEILASLNKVRRKNNEKGVDRCDYIGRKLLKNNHVAIHQEKEASSGSDYKRSRQSMADADRSIQRAFPLRKVEGENGVKYWWKGDSNAHSSAIVPSAKPFSSVEQAKKLHADIVSMYGKIVSLRFLQAIKVFREKRTGNILALVSKLKEILRNDDIFVGRFIDEFLPEAYSSTKLLKNIVSSDRIRTAFEADKFQLHHDQSSRTNLIISSSRIKKDKTVFEVVN
mmetsp:Transcript_21223/g.27353  ORF Transcript_21223/g.27353 Transcript_21223/m.27353 type:complete len:264 (+) Transcript_21223:89-880(+)|eukprot:CAMPEP_0116058506 /NCGR_PEP_ID=MMETSP0322-20121206/5238_1 /TAXON_ID=163516 /ORGANISM="Leptocylindrus danicus var. apora, Strain B651" /LENGTH=263 /DNA_ID=CAMNT_0003542703 /DNA_START=12 /DNA_END=803 /DNA_ORIENTATION=-